MFCSPVCNTEVTFKFRFNKALYTTKQTMCGHPLKICKQLNNDGNCVVTVLTKPLPQSLKTHYCLKYNYRL